MRSVLGCTTALETVFFEALIGRWLFRFEAGASAAADFGDRTARAGLVCGDAAWPGIDPFAGITAASLGAFRADKASPDEARTIVTLQTARENAKVCFMSVMGRAGHCLQV